MLSKFHIRDFFQTRHITLATRHGIRYHGLQSSFHRHQKWVVAVKGVFLKRIPSRLETVFYEAIRARCGARGGKQARPPAGCVIPYVALPALPV